jgi:N-acetylmuramoyl-L-alanine amidase
MIVTTAFMCMTLNVYFESRGESHKGQKAVAYVTWNRAQQNIDNVCDEVFKPKQFSWTYKKARKIKKKDKILYEIKMPKNKFDNEAWLRAAAVSAEVIYGDAGDPTKGATYFHAKSELPDWVHKKRRLAVIDNHYFYK